MTTFWLLAGVLLLLAIAAFLPALRRGSAASTDSQQARTIEIARERLRELEAEHKRGELDADAYQQARRELERNLAAELGEESGGFGRSSALPMIIVLAVLIPLISLGSYQLIGSPEHVAVVGPGVDPAQTAAHGAGGPQDMESLVRQLAERLESEPDNADGWYMLARSYMAMGRFEDAIVALEKLRALIGDHPTALVMLADATAMSQGGALAGRPEELVLKVLEQQPDDATALWLAGKAAEERGDYAVAVDYWRRAEPALAEEPDMQAELRQMISQAEAAGGLEASEPPRPVPAAGSIDVTVDIDPVLVAEARPDDRLFVFARAVEGPPMPLAAARLTVADLPARVTLDDSMAMMPAMKLSSVPQVQVVARVSRGGEPVAQSGDLESEPQIVDVGAGAAVSLVIDRKVP